MTLLVAVILAAAAGWYAGDRQAAVKIPEKVSVPVAVPCVDDASRPAKLELRSEAEILELDDYKVIAALRADRGRALEQLDVLEAIVESCSRIRGPSSSSSRGALD